MDLRIDGVRPATAPVTEPPAARPGEAIQPLPAGIAGDAAALAGHRAGRAAPSVADRRQQVLANALAMLAPIRDERTAFQKWVTPAADAKTQYSRALRQIGELQSADALPEVAAALGRSDVPQDKALSTLKTLLPFADAGQLQATMSALPASAPASARQAVSSELANRHRGVAAQRPADLSTAHWHDAAHGVVDFVSDMTVGTVKQLVDDPLHFPTQLVWGIGSSLHHAVKDTGGALMGLATGGRHGAFGSGMTASLGNAVTWASGFAEPRRTNLHPEFADVQKLTKEGFARDLGSRHQYVKPNPPLSTWLKGKVGVSDAVAGTVGRAEKRLQHGIAKVWYGTDVVLPGETGKRAGALWKDVGSEPMKADHVLGSASPELFEYFSNKWNEAHTVNTHAKGAMPDTHLAASLLDDLGLKPPKGKDGAAKAEFLRQLQARLDERFPQGYFLKGVADYNTAGNLPTNKSRFADLHAGYMAEYLPFEQALKDKHPGADIQPQLKTHPHQGGRTLAALIDDPQSVIIQEKLPLKRYTQKDVGIGKQPFNEYRLHVVHGKVVPGATSHRWSMWHYLTGGKTMKAAETWAQSQIDKLPTSITHATALCPDVVQLQDGSFRFIEMNAFGNSGFLHFNPIAAHSLVEAVTGKETGARYALRRVGRSVAASTLVATHQPQADGGAEAP